MGNAPIASECLKIGSGTRAAWTPIRLGTRPTAGWGSPFANSEGTQSSLARSPRKLRWSTSLTRMASREPDQKLPRVAQSGKRGPENAANSSGKPYSPYGTTQTKTPNLTNDLLRLTRCQQATSSHDAPDLRHRQIRQDGRPLPRGAAPPQKGPGSSGHQPQPPDASLQDPRQGLRRQATLRGRVLGTRLTPSRPATPHKATPTKRGLLYGLERAQTAPEAKNSPERAKSSQKPPSAPAPLDPTAGPIQNPPTKPRPSNTMAAPKSKALC